MKNLIIVLLFFLNHHLISQTLISDTTNLFKVYKHERELMFMSHFDTTQIILRNQFASSKSSVGENSFTLMRDTTLLHSFTAEAYIKDIVIYDKPLILFTKNPSLEGREPVYSLFELSSGKLIDLNLKEYLLAYYDGHFLGGQPNIAKYDGYGDYVTELKKISLNTYKHSTITEFENNPEKAEGIVEVLPFSKSNNLIVKISYCYTPFSGCEESRSYLINLDNEIKVSQIKTDSNSEILNTYKGVDGDHYLVEMDEGFFIISQDGQTVPSLSKKHHLKGWNYQDGKLHSYNFKSTLDEKKYKLGKTLKEVIIPYKLTYKLEISLYNIYHDQEIDKSLLKKIGLYELLILKNLVFAKHNYAFNSRFYQAFFNLFSFYNTDEMRKSRTKDVNAKLTGVDKKNLEVINKALKKYE